MERDRSPATGDAKKITQSFLGILDVILTSIHESVVILDADSKVVRANHAFYRTFHTSADEVEGVTICDLGNRQWDIPRLRELLENTLPENSKFDEFELEHKFEDLGHKVLHLNARWIFRDANQPKFIFLAIADVTELEYNRRGLEQLVEKRLIDLSEAREEAEERRQIAETSLLEIKKLKDQLEAERAYLQDEIKLEYNDENILGKSDGLNDVHYKIEQISRSNTTVLILGETGTGKELVARALHSSSLRKNRALIKVNYSTTKKGPSPGPRPNTWGDVRLPTEAPCFSMKSENYHWSCRQNCCGLSRTASLKDSAVPIPLRSTRGSWPPPTETWKKKSARAGSVKTYGTV